MSCSQPNRDKRARVLSAKRKLKPEKIYPVRSSKSEEENTSPKTIPKIEGNISKTPSGEEKMEKTQDKKEEETVSKRKEKPEKTIPDERSQSEGDDTFLKVTPSDEVNSSTTEEEKVSFERHGNSETDTVLSDGTPSDEVNRNETLEEKVQECAVKFRDCLDTELTIEKVNDIVGKNIQLLQNILEKKVDCARNVLYERKTLESKNQLLHLQHIDVFSDRHYQWVKNKLRELFCKIDDDRVDHIFENQHTEYMKYESYFRQVLIPECFTLLYMEVCGVGRDEAEMLMNKTPLRQEDDGLDRI